MFCAYMFPRMASSSRMEAMPGPRRLATKVPRAPPCHSPLPPLPASPRTNAPPAHPPRPSPSPQSVVVGATLALGGWWYFTYFTLPKREYNKAHPFTSFIPLFCYMVLRNMSPLLRRWHMHMFAWTGKITLETYILQFHVWMKTTGVNGSPKHLMVAAARPPPAGPTTVVPRARRSPPRLSPYAGVAAGVVLDLPADDRRVHLRLVPDLQDPATLRDVHPEDNAKIVGHSPACVVLGALFAVGAALRGEAWRREG